MSRIDSSVISFQVIKVMIGRMRKIPQEMGGRNMKRLFDKQMKKMAAMCLAGCMITTLGGCGSASKYATDTAMAENKMSMAYEDGVMQETDGGYLMESAAMDDSVTDASAGAGATEIDNSAANAHSDRKLIKTVDISVETKEFELMMATLEEQVDALGGYIEHMDTYNGSRYSYYISTRSASMTIRIPKDKLNGFLNTVSDIGNVISRSENVEDVTLSYVDIESRKKSLSTEQDRLLELLEQAENMEDIITIEERLSNIRYQLESMESQLRTYDNKVDYSTVYLNVSEVRELTPVEEKTTGERIADGFMESLKDIGNGLKEFVVWFLVHIPYMVIWAVIIVAVVLIVKIMRKRRRIRKEKKLEQTQQNATDVKK